MNSLFSDHLKDLITLENKKVLPGCHKKIVSTSIFIPENPSVNCKTFFYFTDLIKSVETFNDLGLKDWIYRIYVDDMFFNAITKKELAEVVKASDSFGTKDVYINQLIEDIEKSNTSSDFSPITKKTKKRNSNKKSNKGINNSIKTPINENQDSQHIYDYNKSDNAASVETRQKVKTIKTKLKETSNGNNIIRLKKMIKLLNLYLQIILNSKSPRYKNIEIVSFRCDKVRLNNSLPGHPSTFGSFMRFFPVFDSNVAMFVSVNSRLPLNPLQKFVIESWEKNEKKKLLSINYKTTAKDDNGFIGDCMYENILSEIRKAQEKTKLNTNDELLVEIVNGILNMKETLMEIPMEKRVNFASFRKINELGNEKRELAKIGKLIGYTDSTSNFSRLQKINALSIFAGFFGMKNEAILFGERVTLFTKLVKYYINTSNKFSFGIDELMLKLILAYESGTLNFDYGIVDYGGLGEFGTHKNQHFQKELDYITTLYDETGILTTPTQLLHEHHVFKKKNSVLNSKGKVIGLKTSISDEPDPTYIRYSLLDNADFEIAGLAQSRNLYSSEEAESLNKDEPITIKYYYDDTLEPENLILRYNELFNTFNENKKLVVYDSGLNTRSTFQEFINMDNIWTRNFNRIDLKGIPLKDISNVLKKIIKHYRTNCVNFNIEFVKV